MSSVRQYFKFLLFLAAITVGPGCVYYNTFFMAKQKFNNAEKSQEENRQSQLRLDEQSSGKPGDNDDNSKGNISKPNTPPPRSQPSVITSRVTQQERTLYEDAIEKAKNVLTFHPDSKWVDDALWLIGKSYFSMGEFSSAEKRFKELVTNHPESKYADDSYYYLGLCLISLNLKDQALSAFANIENAPKKSPYLEYVLFAKANMEMGDENFDDAIEIYTRFLEKYPSSDSAAMAMYNIGHCHEKEKDYLTAYEAFTKVEKYSPSRRLHFDAMLAAATASIAGDSVAIGMKILDELSRDDRYFSRAGELNLKSAEGYYRQGDLDKAIQLYTDVTVQNPRSPLSAEAFYRLGVIYQNDKFDLEAAKSAFSKSQSEFADSEFRNLALARSAQIAKLETYRIQLQKADSLTRIERMEAIGQEESGVTPVSPAQDAELDTLQPKLSAIDSTSADKADSVSMPTDSIKIALADSQAAVSHTPSIPRSDSLSINVSADSQTAVEPATPQPDSIATDIPADTLAQKQAGTTIKIAAPKVDTTGFGNIPFVERMRRAYGQAEADSILQEFSAKPADTVTVVKDSVTAAKNDTLAVTKINTPQPQKTAPVVSAKVNQDSIRQAIMQSGIETRFLLAELYAYELNRPDSALEEYLLIVTEYPRSPYAPKSLLAASHIESARGDSAAASALLEQLLNNYSESPQAAEAARILNSPANPLNAMDLYSAAENFVFSGENPDSAVVLYRYIAQNFPDLAAKAAYAAAWTLDQVIGVEDSSAYYAYSELSKKYPQTEYAQAASDRISTASHRTTKRSTPAQEQYSAGEDSLNANPDTTDELALGLPIAPKVTKPGVFLYPEALLSQDLKGKVIFKIKLNFSGKVEDHQIIGPSGERLIDSTAIQTLLQTEFDVSSLDLSQLDGYFQYSISFKRPTINMYNDPYRQQREQGP